MGVSLPVSSSEPTAPGDDEEGGASPEPEAEKDLEAPEAERQADTHDGRTETHSADEQTEKRSSSPAPPTTEPASAPAEPAPSAPEENRVGLSELSGQNLNRSPF